MNTQACCAPGCESKGSTRKKGRYAYRSHVTLAGRCAFAERGCGVRRGCWGHWSGQPPRNALYRYISREHDMCMRMCMRMCMCMSCVCGSSRGVSSQVRSLVLSLKAYRLLQETPRWIRRLVATIPVRMVPACLPVRLDVRFLQALVGPRTRSFLATVLLLALGFTVFYLADAQELSIIDALCKICSPPAEPQPHTRG